MSVYQVKEYYVYIQFKEKLTAAQRAEVREFLMGCQLDQGFDLRDGWAEMDRLDSEDEAEDLNYNFRAKFSNLIK